MKNKEQGKIVLPNVSTNLVICPTPPVSNSKGISRQRLPKWPNGTWTWNCGWAWNWKWQVVMQECVSIRKCQGAAFRNQMEPDGARNPGQDGISPIIHSTGRVVRQFYWELSFRLKFSRLEIIVSGPPQVCWEISLHEIKLFCLWTAYSLNVRMGVL